MTYADASFLVKLYVFDADSHRARAAVQAVSASLAVSPFTALELRNALRLLAFRKQMSTKQVGVALAQIDAHMRQGRYFDPGTQWTDVTAEAERLSQLHAAKLGVRTLDLLHVATAVVCAADRFLTFDRSQARLATGVGLNTKF